MGSTTQRLLVLSSHSPSRRASPKDPESICNLLVSPLVFEPAPYPAWQVLTAERRKGGREGEVSSFVRDLFVFDK
jgi:hypothetical protein